MCIRDRLRNMEALAQEALHLAGAADGQLVLFAQFVHAHDGNDILQLLVALQQDVYKRQVLQKVPYHALTRSRCL